MFKLYSFVTLIACIMLCLIGVLRERQLKRRVMNTEFEIIFKQGAVAFSRFVCRN
jgi:hypothetical protein